MPLARTSRRHRRVTATAAAVVAATILDGAGVDGADADAGTRMSTAPSSDTGPQHGTLLSAELLYTLTSPA